MRRHGTHFVWRTAVGGLSVHCVWSCLGGMRVRDYVIYVCLRGGTCVPLLLRNLCYDNNKMRTIGSRYVRLGA